MDALLTSTFLVALAEIGDKTQLLSLVLAARYNKPLPIIAGIFAATLLNHAAAAWLGSIAGGMLSGEAFQWGLAIAFIAIGLWVLKPDVLDDVTINAPNSGVFITTTITFFLAEMGDKTQLATVALGAEYDATVMVVLGTTIGMLAANAPVVYFGKWLMDRLPLSKVRVAASLLFIGFGVYSLPLW